ncbi:hypothetical protein RhiLY_11968 [Ceratobasidium sp. AG-Ba]|nr:hypothetical protein RhiLY_11968 [Ceratobasidium sp. AG-Ba]
MALVDTRINYFTPPPDGAKPYQWIDSGVEPRRNWTPVEFGVKAENVRGHEQEFTLDKSGFEFHHAPSPEKLFDDEERIKEVYYEDAINRIKEFTGASRVVIFDHTIRRPRPEGTPDTPENRAPVKIVTSTKLLNLRHAACTCISRPKMFLPYSPSDSRLSTSGSVNDKKDEGDFVPTTLKYKDRDGETLSVKHTRA